MKASIVPRGLLFATVAFLVLYPLSMMLIGSFRSAIIGVKGTWGIAGWIEAYSDPDMLRIIWNTILIASAKTVISVFLAVTFAWAIHRTNMPGRRLLDGALHLNLFLLPPLPLILGWSLIFGPRTGIANKWFVHILGEPLFNVYSLAGIVFVMLSFSLSVYYIFLSPAFKSMDITLEEAARMSGASGFTTLRKVIIPLLTPAILACTILSLIRGMEAFEAPFFLGGSSGIDVLGTKIFDYMTGEPPDVRAALATGVTLLAITFVLVLFQWKILGTKEFITVTGKGYRPRPMDLGRWRWPLFIVLGLLLGGLTIPPGVILVQTTFLKIVGVYSIEGGAWTLNNWKNVFSQPTILEAIKNTIILGVSAATLSVCIVTLVSYVVVKTRFVERKALDLIAWIPWAIPGIVLSLALLWAWIFVKPLGFSLYGTLVLMVICMVTVGFPIGTKIMTSTMIQISDELEESARVSGASWPSAFLRIWMPLLKNGLLTAWLLKYAATVRVLAPVVLIYSPKSRVISTTFYEMWYRGEVESASVVGILQAGIIMAGYVAVKLVGRIGGIKTEEAEKVP